MIPYHIHPSDRPFGERKAHRLSIAGDYGRLVGHRLAAEDSHRAGVAYADQARRLADAGLHRPGVGAWFSYLRQAIGVVLIRTGERLRGAPLSSTSPTEAPLPGTAVGSNPGSWVHQTGR